MNWLKYVLLCTVILFSCGREKHDGVMGEVFAAGDENFQQVIAQKDKYEVQILFSPIQRKEDTIIVEDHFFNFRPDEYFYPASSVKMPVAFLALQKLEELRKAGIKIDRHTRITIDSTRSVQIPVENDTTSKNNYASIGHYIDKLFAISDNDAYNRLYEFTGQDYINSHLRTKQIFTNSRIVHRVGVDGFSVEENRHTPSINFLDDDGTLVYKQSTSYAQANHVFPLSKTNKGVAYIDSEGKKIEKPFDFSQKNFINIRDLQESLKRMILPELFPKRLQYEMSKEDELFVMQSMAKLPRDHQYLAEKKEEYYDGYVKFFLYGDSKEPIPDHIIIRNKVGFAYGYLTDCAYIHDTKEGIEYFLTATIHVNDNQTYNDGVYEYDNVGIPFLAELGRKTHKWMITQKSK